MQLIRQTTDLAETLASTIQQALNQSQKVLWLVPGGSNIPVSVQASQSLDPSTTSNLTILQTDERYVAPDSPDCNWKSLIDNGLALHQATALPILATTQQSLEQTTQRYNQVVAQQFDQAQVIIGQFGLGSDSHIAGVKPDSPGIDSQQWVVGYQAEDFTRVTLTLKALKKVSIARVFAFGTDKQSMLQSLITQPEQSLSDSPAAILHSIPDTIIYTDAKQAPAKDLQPQH